MVEILLHMVVLLEDAECRASDSGRGRYARAPSDPAANTQAVWLIAKRTVNKLQRKGRAWKLFHATGLASSWKNAEAVLVL